MCGVLKHYVSICNILFPYLVNKNALIKRKQNQFWKKILDGISLGNAYIIFVGKQPQHRVTGWCCRHYPRLLRI